LHGAYACAWHGAGHGANQPAFTYTQVDARPFGDNASHWYGIFDKANVINARPGRPKYPATDLVNIADNIVLFQKDNGGWPKNYDIFAVLDTRSKG